MKSGILLSLDELTGVEIAADGQTVTVAGGTKSHVLSHALWDAGKQAGKCVPPSYTHLDPVCVPLMMLTYGGWKSLVHVNASRISDPALVAATDSSRAATG